MQDLILALLRPARAFRALWEYGREHQKDAKYEGVSKTLWD